jgi:cold-inducible RNA-binding protein
MKNTKVYVDNLATATTENELRDLFSPYGNVAEVSVPVHQTNGRPRGFGFVTMATPEGARAAIRALHGKEMGSRALTVSEAWPHEENPGPAREGRNPRRSVSHLF